MIDSSKTADGCLPKIGGGSGKRCQRAMILLPSTRHWESRMQPG